MTFIPPYEAHPVFAYRWTRAPFVAIPNKQALFTYSYTGFGFVRGEMGVLVRVFTNGGITTSTFFTSDPFPF